MNLENLKTTAFLNGISLIKLPLLAFISPKVVALTDKQSIVKVNLGWRTKNHLGVMYFGSLAMGAELSIALKALTEIQKSQKKIDFLFKDFSCEFLKRADGDVHFICDEAEKVSQLIQEAAATNERTERKFTGHALVPSKSAEPVMKYTLTLTVKNRSPL
jgi:hypothetical protein